MYFPDAPYAPHFWFSFPDSSVWRALLYFVMQKFIIGLAIFGLCGLVLSLSPSQFPFTSYPNCNDGNWVGLNFIFMKVAMRRLTYCIFNKAMCVEQKVRYLYDKSGQDRGEKMRNRCPSFYKPVSCWSRIWASWLQMQMQRKPMEWTGWTHWSDHRSWTRRSTGWWVSNRYSKLPQTRKKY